MLAKASLVLVVSICAFAPAALPPRARAALTEANRLLAARQPCAAVRLLEAEVSRIEGDRPFLNSLAEAFRRCIPELEETGDFHEAKSMLDRLRILDPTAVRRAPAPPMITERTHTPMGRPPVVTEIREPAPSPRVPALPPCANRPVWKLTESRHFCLYHSPFADGDGTARIAETTRTAVLSEWFGLSPDSIWAERGDIYLHATGEAYERETTVPRASPGHTTILSSTDARVRRREVHVALDAGKIYTTVLPHEVTHAVIADRFGRWPVPRWADEGMAIFSEPESERVRHLDVLRRVRDERRLIPLDQLLRMERYPAAALVGAFYAQSVALVKYLVDWRGKPRFAAFLRDAMRNGNEAALKAHYGFDRISDLERALGW